MRRFAVSVLGPLALVGLLGGANALTRVRHAGAPAPSLEGDAGLAADVEAGRLRPISLASGDVDGDAIADLVVGYAGDGVSAVGVLRGDYGAIIGKAPGPFPGPTRLVAVSERPDFLAVADVDADGHAEIVAAARGGHALHAVAAGRDERSVELPGPITALASGEVDTMDGITDLVAGVSAPDGPAVLVFSSPEGAFAASPERVALPAEASEIALGQTDGDYPFEIVVAAGSDVVVARGHARMETGPRTVEVRDADVAALGVLSKTSSLEAPPPSGSDIVAAIPMTLNADGVTDYAVLEAGATAPSYVLSSPRLNFTVSTLADSGGGSLRAAITSANSNPGADQITFAVAGTIALSSALPTITDTVSIDGTTAPGYAGSPVVEINGQFAAVVGLNVAAPNSVVRGLCINRCAQNGIFVGANGATIQSNFVGTNIAGTSALGNSSTGIQVNASNCMIGGSTASGNLVSGNGVHGIAPSGGTSGNVVAGNLCGTDLTGNAPLPNFGSGIDVNNTTNNTIGGPTAASRNVLCANFTNGLTIFSNAGANVVQNNLIGVGTGGAAMGNSGQGVRVHIGDGCTIGGSASAGNTVSNNGKGVVVLQCTGVSVRGNSISSNGNGIDLDDNGVTLNDPGDADGGANNDQNYPVITLAATSGPSTLVQGTLDSTPGTMFTIDLYSNPTCHPSGFGEGATYLGTTVCSTDGTGAGSFMGFVPAVTPGEVVTATATSPSGDTSELSACVAAIAAADMTVGVGVTPTVAIAGDTLTITVTVANNGSADAANASLVLNPFASTAFVSLSAPPGWTCSTPPVGGSGTITCDTPLLASGANAIFTVIVRVDPSLPAGSAIAIDAGVSTSTPEINVINNFLASAVLTDALADLGVTASASPASALPGDDLTYVVSVSNAGPSDAVAVSLTDVVPADAGFVSLAAPQGWSCSTPGPLGSGPVTCTTQVLPAGASAEFTLVMRVNFGVAAGSVISNAASVSSSVSDPSGGNDSASASVTIGAQPIADLSLQASATPSTVAPGSTLTLGFDAANAGPSDAPSLTVTVPLPAGVTFVSATPSEGGSCTAPAQGGTGTVTCVWEGATPIGLTRSTLVVVRVDPNAADQSVVTVTGTASSGLADPDSTNNSATAVATVAIAPGTPVADLGLSIGDVPTEIDTGDRLEYEITVSNDGPATASGVSVSGSTPEGTRLASISVSQGTVSGPAAGATGSFTATIGELDAAQSATVTLAVTVVAAGGSRVATRAVVSAETADPNPFNNSGGSGTTSVRAGNDTLLTWDAPLPCDTDCLNPPLHLQTMTVPSGGFTAPRQRLLRNNVLGYNVYRSNQPNVQPTPQNFFTTVPASVTSLVAPTAPSGSFFTVTANYPNGESPSTNAASGGIPEPAISGFLVGGAKVTVIGERFTDHVQVFVDGIPFKKQAKVKNGNTRIVQKGKLLTGQSVAQYLQQQGGVVLVSVLNTDTGIGTFLYIR